MELDEVTMPFGKFRGERVADISDIRYLRWVVSNVDIRSEHLRLAIEQQIENEPDPDPSNGDDAWGWGDPSGY